MSNKETEELGIEAALQVVAQYGQGGEEIHHAHWIIDQMVRKLTGDNYDQFIKDIKSGDDGDNTYSWYVGVAP